MKKLYLKIFKSLFNDDTNSTKFQRLAQFWAFLAPIIKSKAYRPKMKKEGSFYGNSITEGWDIVWKPKAF